MTERDGNARPAPSDRQANVLELVRRGRTNKQIAAALEVSEQAVKQHVSALMRMFDVPNRAALVEAAVVASLLGTVRGEHEWLPYLFAEAQLMIAVSRGPEHVLVHANQAARRFARREIIGRRMRDAFPELEGSGIVELVDTVYATERPYVGHEIPLRLAAPDGPRPVHLDVTLQPIREGGKTAGIVFFASDVSAKVGPHREVEALLARRSAIAEGMADGIAIVDSECRVLYANGVMRQLTGAYPFGRADATARQALAMRDAATGAPLDRTPAERALAGETVAGIEIVYRLPGSGADARLWASAAPIRGADGSIVGGLVRAIAGER